MSDNTTTPDQQDQRDADPQADDTTEALGEAGKAALERERADRKAAEKRARDAEKRLADLDADAKRKADEEAAKQGEWQQLAEKREAELTTTATERDGITAERDALAAYFTAQYTAAVKELPDVIKAFAPADDAPFAAKADWLGKAQEQAKKLGGNESRGNGPNPKPAGNPKPDIKGVLPRRQYIN